METHTTSQTRLSLTRVVGLIFFVFRFRHVLACSFHAPLCHQQAMVDIRDDPVTVFRSLTQRHCDTSAIAFRQDRQAYISMHRL
jgi:hypothetical protein